MNPSLLVTYVLAWFTQSGMMDRSLLSHMSSLLHFSSMKLQLRQRSSSSTSWGTGDTSMSHFHVHNTVTKLNLTGGTHSFSVFYRTQRKKRITWFKCLFFQWCCFENNCTPTRWTNNKIWTWNEAVSVATDDGWWMVEQHHSMPGRFK